MSSNDGIGVMPPEQHSDVTSSSSVEPSVSRLQEIASKATVLKISKIVLNTTTVHDGLKSTADSYVEEYLTSNPLIEKRLIEMMMEREQTMKSELQDKPFSEGDRTLVEKQDDISRELLANSTVLQEMEFVKLLDSFKKNHTDDNSLKYLDELIRQHH